MGQTLVSRFNSKISRKISDRREPLTPTTISTVLSDFESDLTTRSPIPALIEGLKHDRYSAARALARIGHRAVPALIEALQHKEHWMRSAAARALQYIGPEAKAAVPILTETLNDEGAVVRRKTAEAGTAVSGSPNHSAVLLQALTRSMRTW